MHQPIKTLLGRPALPIRLMVGLHLIKDFYGLSDEQTYQHWLENPYIQYFCGEPFFQHHLPLDRSSMTRFGERMGEEGRAALLYSTLQAAYATGQIRLKDLHQVAVDATAQEKAMAHPTEHGLLLKTAQHLRKLSQQTGVTLLQSYARVLKHAAVKVGRYMHARQIARQKRGVTPQIKRDLRRRSVIEPIIGRPQNEGLLRRNQLTG